MGARTDVIYRWKIYENIYGDIPRLIDIYDSTEEFVVTMENAMQEQTRRRNMWRNIFGAYPVTYSHEAMEVIGEIVLGENGNCIAFTPVAEMGSPPALPRNKCKHMIIKLPWALDYIERHTGYHFNRYIDKHMRGVE